MPRRRTSGERVACDEPRCQRRSVKEERARDPALTIEPFTEGGEGSEKRVVGAAIEREADTQTECEYWSIGKSGLKVRDKKWINHLALLCRILLE